MSESARKYLVCIGVGLAISALAAYSGGVLEGGSVRELVGGLSDCFVVSGTLFAGVGGLIWIAGLGGFDMLGYTAASLIGRNKREGYYEYRIRNEKKRAEYRRTLSVGIAFLGVGAVLCFIYGLL
ncbi:MAG: DUF3899 domain-containing protein [Clostridia bacterium]|nr:DUF3899 domain-containing protein [Clostridia bacterium]